MAVSWVKTIIRFGAADPRMMFTMAVGRYCSAGLFDLHFAKGGINSQISLLLLDVPTGFCR